MNLLTIRMVANQHRLAMLVLQLNVAIYQTELAPVEIGLLVFIFR